MSDTNPTTDTEQRPRPWAWLVIGIVLFLILMEVRSESQSIWWRAAFAGLAGAALAFGIVRFKSKRS